MKDQDKTKDQLIAEVKRLRRRIVELERSEKKYLHTAETLRESEEKYSALVNDASDAILIVDENGYILDANKKMEKLTGYAKEKLFSLNIVHIHPEEEVSRTVKVFKDIVSQGYGFFHDGYLLREDGAAVSVDITGSVIRYAGKKVVQGIFRDVSERRESEEKYRASEMKYQQLINTLQEGVWVINENADMVFVNPLMAEMLGYTVKDIIGKSLFSFFRQEDIEQFKEKIQFRQSGIKEIFYFKLISKDGDIINVTVKAAPIFDECGRYRGSIASVTDITERMRIEKKLMESEEKFRDIFEKSPIGIFQSTFNGRFINVNPSLARMMGYDSPREVIEAIHHITEQIYVDPQRCKEVYKIIKQKSEIVRFDSMFFKKDGKKWAGKLTMRLIKDENGRPHHLDGFIEDITQQKAIEVKLQNTMQQLEALSRRFLEVQESERRHVARELHDEIGQVLTAVKINLQAAERPRDDKLTAIAPLKESIKIIDRLLNQVRGLSIKLHPSILDDLGLLAAIRWYLDWISQQGGLKGQFVTKFVKERLSPVREVTCFRIIQESLTNVIRHAKAKNVVVELGEQNKELYLKVKDDGIGFDYKKARNNALKGRSLGLLGMEERVLLLSGRIEIKSRKGQGTEIQVFLPLDFPIVPSDKVKKINP